MERGKNVIIAAYAGTGKSTFAQRVEGAVDMPIMPYRWILPPTEKIGVGLEGEKGALYRLSNPLFPDNYLAEILKAGRDCRFVLIPTNLVVIRRLRENYGRTVLLCYPDDGCREEYRARFLARGNSESFLELFADGWDRFLDPVRDYGQGTHIVMGPGEYLTDLLQQFEDVRRADTAQPVEEETIRDIEKKLSERKKDLVLYLSGDDGCCFYPIKNLDAPEERKFLDQVGRMIWEEDADLVPLIAPKKAYKAESIEAFSTESRDDVRAFVKEYMDRSPLSPAQSDGRRTPAGDESSLSQKRWEAARRREQIIYHRDYDPGNYTESGVLYFSRISVDAVRQLVEEGLLDLQDRHNDAPTVGEMLAFCSGEDETIWFFHGFTVWPERIDCRVTLEGFESLTALEPERIEEFLRFNCRGETEVSEEGACWCWYD